MADIDIRRAHGLGMDGAREAAERMAEHLGRKFDLRGTWKGNVLDFQRPGVTGFLAITGEELHLSVSLGILLKAMRASIERAVVDELERLFASAPKNAPAPVNPKKGPRRPT